MKKFIVLISMILCVNQIKSSEILAGLKSVLFTYPKVTAAVLIGAAAFDSLNSYCIIQDLRRRNEALIFKQ